MGCLIKKRIRFRGMNRNTKRKLCIFIRYVSVTVRFDGARDFPFSLPDTRQKGRQYVYIFLSVTDDLLQSDDGYELAYKMCGQ